MTEQFIKMAIKIKKIEWDRQDGNAWHGRSPWINYHITKYTGPTEFGKIDAKIKLPYWQVACAHGDCCLETFNIKTLESAKAAAQDHFDAMVKSLFIS